MMPSDRSQINDCLEHYPVTYVWDYLHISCFIWNIYLYLGLLSLGIYLFHFLFHFFFHSYWCQSDLTILSSMNFLWCLFINCIYFRIVVDWVLQQSLFRLIIFWQHNLAVASLIFLTASLFISIPVCEFGQHRHQLCYLLISESNVFSRRRMTYILRIAPLIRLLGSCWVYHGTLKIYR